jgi:hypothetical protein
LFSTNNNLRENCLFNAANAWNAGLRGPIEAALDAWRALGVETDLPYWVERVEADSMFERESLAHSLRQAERLARAQGDEIALARLASAVIDALYSDWRPSRDAQRWLDVLRSVAFARLQSLPPPTRLKISVGILAADLYGEALATADRVAESIAAWNDAHLDVAALVRGNALGYALEHFSGHRTWPQATRLVERIDALDRDDRFGSVGRARVAARRGFYFHYRRGDYAGALVQSRAAIQAAKEAAVGRAAREAAITASLCHLMCGEIAGASDALAAERAAMPEGHLMMRANLHYESAWWHALQRDVVAAQRELDVACKLFAEIDEHGVMSLATPSLQAQLLVQVGEYAAALRVFEMRTRRPDAWLVDIAFIEALASLAERNQERAAEHMARGVEIASRIDIKGVFWGCRKELCDLFKIALQQNIGVEWIASVVAARKLTLD